MKGNSMDILFTDKHIIICEKPSGTVCEGEGENALPTLLSRQLAEMGEKNTRIFPVHRLDKETVGVCVFARTSASAAALSESITKGELDKEYLAVVCGAPEKNSDTLTDLLYYDRSRGKSFVVDRQRNGVKKATLDYDVIDTREGFSLLRIRLHTGRTHQIRVQLASRGLPLAGDRRYGAPKNGIQTVSLCAHKLSFPHPVSGEQMQFSVSTPSTQPWSLFEI